MMNTSSLVILLVAFRFQTVCGNSIAAFDKHYSDKLIRNNNQQSTPGQNNEAYHATTLFPSNRFQILTTDPSIDLQTPHEALHLAANKHYETSRFRRSTSSSSSGSSDDSIGTGTTSNTGIVGILPEDNDNDVKKPINFLRLYFCGTGYQNCMYDERLNKVQNDFLKQIPRMAEITLPTNVLDWKSKQLSLPISIKDVGNQPGRNDRGFTAEEPHYVLVRSDEASPRHLALLSGPDFMDDPFIPQRGRRQPKVQTYDDPFYPMRGRRADAQAWDDPFFPMRGRRTNKNAKAWDDPFIPMRGRRSDKNTNEWDDPFVPMRGRRHSTNDKNHVKRQPWDDPFIPMRGRKWSAKSIAYDDPFIPMRGRKADYNDAFILPRERRSIHQKERRKRSLLASTGTFNAVYTPSEEVIVKLNSAHDTKNPSSPFQSKNHLLSRHEQNSEVNQLIDGMTSHSELNMKRPIHAKKSHFLHNNFASNPDDGDSELMNDYAIDAETPQMIKSGINENQLKWMISSRDLSQNRDAKHLARGSGALFSF